MGFAFEPTFGGTFPTAVEVMPYIHGIWKCTGGSTFKGTGLLIGVDADHKPVWLAKADAGREALVENCNVSVITGFRFSVFLPDANPYEDEPLFVTPEVPVHSGYRVRFDSP